MSSLLVRAGRLVYSAGKLLLGSAQACIDMCCEAVDWYCCWVSSDRSMGSQCQTGQCDEGLARSGPFQNDGMCVEDCHDDRYYCCLASDGSMNCRLGGCLPGEIVAAVHEQMSGCQEVCSTETTGACCWPDMPCWETGNPGECVTASSYWSRNECGECAETTAGAHFGYGEGEGPALYTDGCRVYEENNCVGSGAIPRGLGYPTQALCERDGRIARPCVNGQTASQCLNEYLPGKSKYTWHPNKQCYEVPCPTDCYGNGQPSACEGSPRDYAGETCFAGIYCEVLPEATVTISGAAVPFLDDGNGGNACDYPPDVHDMVRDAINSTFILPSDVASSGYCFGPVTASDSVQFTPDPVNFPNVQITYGVLVTVSLLFPQPYNYPPNDPRWCNKNWCCIVQVAVNLVSCPNNDFPTPCSGGSNAGVCNAATDLLCVKLEPTYQKACDCGGSEPNVYKCELTMSGNLVQSGYCNNACLDMFSGTTASITIA